MLLNEETQEKVNKLPIVLKTAVNTLLECIDQIINGKCNEEVITSTMGTLHNNAKSRYGNNDVLNYDQAGKMLGFGTTNRVGLKKLLDKNGIKEVKIGNTKIGFRRDELQALCDKIHEDVIKRNRKRERKIFC